MKVFEGADGVNAPVIIGISPAIRNLLDFIKKAAKSDANVLILGETGVGKELVAKAIHCLSARKEGPFVKLNYASLNENLVEGELFGHKKKRDGSAHMWANSFTFAPIAENLNHLEEVYRFFIPYFAMLIKPSLSCSGTMINPWLDIVAVPRNCLLPIDGN